MTQVPYDAIPTSRLHELLKEWIEEELHIPKQAIPSVLAVLGVKADELTEEAHQRLAKLAEDPERVHEAYETLEELMSEWLVFSSLDLFERGQTIPTNTIQLRLMANDDSALAGHFTNFLQDLDILRAVEAHPWGAPYQRWHLSETFLHDYLEEVRKQHRASSSTDESLYEVLAHRQDYRDQLAHCLLEYVGNHDLSALSVEDAYRTAAVDLQVDLMLLLDAERVILDGRTTPPVRARGVIT